MGAAGEVSVTTPAVGGSATGGSEPRAAVDPWAALVPEANRRMVLAAIEAFAAQGYHASTTRDIAARAGLSPAALYVHYPSKGALLAQISRVGHEAALALVEEALANGDGGPADPRDGLRAVVASFTAWHARHHRMARVVQYELAAVPRQDLTGIVMIRRKIEQLLEDLIAGGVAQGVMSAGVNRTPRALARGILSLGIDVARWYDPLGRDTPDHLGLLYADLAARMVGAVPSTAADPVRVSALDGQ